MSDATRTSKERDWRAGCECNRAGLCFRCQAAAEIERLNLQLYALTNANKSFADHAAGQPANRHTALGGGNIDLPALIHRLRFQYADNGAGYNSEFTADMRAAADELERLQSRVADLQQYHDWAEPQIGHYTKQRDEIERLQSRVAELESASRPPVGYQCMVAGCPGQHASKREVCGSAENVGPNMKFLEIVEYLRVYGRHIPTCQVRPCECGFQKVWETYISPAKREGQA